MVSFHFQVAGRTFVTTLSPNDKTQDLCDMSSIDFFKVHMSMTIAYIVCNLGYKDLNFHATWLPYFVMHV